MYVVIWIIWPVVLSGPESPTVNIFIDDEVEQLKDILVFVEEKAGNTGIHFSHQPWLQLFCAVHILRQKRKKKKNHTNSNCQVQTTYLY